MATTDRRLRLSRLESKYGPQRGGVLRLLPNETIETALERAAQEGRKGPYLIAPHTPSREQWEEEAIETMRELSERAKRLIEVGFNAGDALGQ